MTFHERCAPDENRNNVWSSQCKDLICWFCPPHHFLVKSWARGPASVLFARLFHGCSARSALQQQWRPLSQGLSATRFEIISILSKCTACAHEIFFSTAVVLQSCRMR